MFAIVEKQQDDVIKGICPVMQDLRIKTIPIIDCKEELVDIHKMNHKNIRMLPTPALPFSGPNTNAGFECSSLIRKGLWQRLEAMSNNLRLLHPESSISILIFEGLRDCQTQAKLFDLTVQQLSENSPEGKSTSEIQKQAEKFITPPNEMPPHATGGCVALRLFNDDKNEFLDMGKFGYLWFPENKNDESNTFSANLTKEQIQNRLLLLNVATMAGLVNYPYEWWHFSFGDRYFCYYTKNKTAIYSSV